MEPETILSVVVVCRNEEEKIERCLASVVRGLSRIRRSEIVVADSASTDGTVAIASRFPVRLVLLPAHGHLSPAAGRHAGFVRSRGKYVAFVDGDMEVEEGWFSFAVEEMERDERLAGVTGVENQIFVVGGREVGGRTNAYAVPPEPSAAKVLAGSALFRRAALEAVGDFHPYLFSEEEADLCYRLRRAGQRLAAYPIEMVRHYSLPRRSREEIVRRHRSGLYLGPGQVLRRSLGHGLFLAHLWRFRLFVAYISMCAAGIGALLLGACAGLWRPSVLWALLAAVAVAGLAAKKRSLREAGLSLFAWTLVAAGMIRGFARASRRAETYPVPETRAPETGAGDRGET